MSDPFSSTPVAEQQLLLDEIGRVYLLHARWPTRAYLEEFLERHNLDARTVAFGFPKERVYGYGWVRPIPLNVQPRSPIGLTIAGLHHVIDAAPLILPWVRMIGALGTIRSTVRLDPFAEEIPRASKSDVATFVAGTAALRGDQLDFLCCEPATWNCQVVDSSDEWVIELTPEIRRFAGVGTVDAYLGQLHRLVAAKPPRVTATPEFASPVTLPAWLDYLDAVWRLRFGAGLLVPPGIERSARLALDVEAVEEADSALSALAEVLKTLAVPGVEGVGGHPLSRLVPYLGRYLTEQSTLRVSQAVEVLNAARQLRAGAQHTGAQPDAIAAYAILGLPYPVVDWPAGWRRIQQAVSYACDIIRQEIHAC